MKHTNRIRPVIMVLPTIIFAFPLYFLIKTSFEKRGIENYTYVITELDVGINIFNSIIVAVLTVCIVALITLPAAFAFSKLNFKAKNVLFLLVLMAMMVPGISIAVPMVKIIRSMGLVNNYFALILPYVALNSPLALILAKNFMDGISNELMEAGMIDGCTVWKSFIHIYLPLAKPVLAITSVFTFLNCWNEFVYAKLFMQDEAMQMVSTIPIKFQVDMYTNIPGLFAGLVIVQLPVLILYLLFQNVFKEGLTAGAVKG